MLIWASKLAADKIECNFEMGKCTPQWVTFILLSMVQILKSISSQVIGDAQILFSQEYVPRTNTLSLFQF